MSLESTSATYLPEEDVCAESRLAYLHAGRSGRVVVLLHGWSAFKELWWSTLVALAPAYRVYAPDLPGHGHSPIDTSWSMQQIAARIACFCRARQIEQMVLVGHSMGGNIAMELALQEPGMIEQLVLVAPAAEAPRMPRYTRTYLTSMRGWTTLRLGMLLARLGGTIGRQVPHLHGGGLVRPALRRAAYWSRHDATALRGLLDGLFANVLTERMAAISMPTLVVSGAYDPLVPAALSQQIAARIPGARYAVVPGAGHNPMDERPLLFERLLLDFLRTAHQ